MDACRSTSCTDPPLGPPVSDFDPVPATAAVARSEFDAVIKRLELRLSQLETSLQHDLEQSYLEVVELQPSVAPCFDQPSVGVGFDTPEPSLNFQAEPKVQDKEDARKESAHPENFHDQVYFTESVWNLPLVLDFQALPWWDVFFSLILLLVNLGMQVMFSLILFTDDFAGDSVNVEEEVENARKWRTSIAHDWRHMDLGQTSLVSRVCQGNGALIISTPQAELVGQINSFLGLGTNDFEPSFLQPGILLCMLCILHWSLCVYKEFRSIWLALEAVVVIPKSSHTSMDDSIQSLSMLRCFFIFLTFLLRLVIASMLLVAGISWLARTTSITELMLNAVALNGIMDVDELLFCGFTPVSVQRTLRKLKPIKMQYSRARSQIESLLLFMLLAATMLIPYFVYLEPLGAGMVTIKHEMCGGNQTFVVAFNPEVQEVVGLTTKSGLYEEEPTLSEVAVEHHKFQTEGPPQYILFTNSRQIFDDLRSSPMTNAAAKLPFCPETDALQASGPFYQDPLVTPILETRLRSAAVALGIPPTSAWSCEDLAHLCSRPEARLLRLVCGETCGCTDPFASPWHKVQTQGCSDLCSLRGELSLATQKCDDQPKGGAWDEFWSGYPAAMGSYYGQNATQTAVWPLASSIAQQLQQLGCQGLRIPELQIEPASNVVWCHGSDTLFRPLAWLCPVSCGCLDQPQPYCPPNCRNGTVG